MLQVLEKCFVDDYDGERIKGIIKETILRADQTLLQARKQSLNLFNVSNEEVKRDVDKFFKEFMRNDTGEDKGNDDRKLILDLQMKLQTKGALVDSYAAEIERLQREQGENATGAGQDDLARMYNDIDSLNSTIEQLKKENVKLKTGMLALGGGKNFDGGASKNLDMDQIDDLLEKIGELDSKLREREHDSFELKRLESIEVENTDLKREVQLLEESMRRIGLDDQQLVAESKELQRTFELKEMDYRRLTENYDDLHKRLRCCEDERSLITQDRDRLASSVLDIQKSHENELCNLKGTLEYLTEKMSVLTFERQSKEIIQELEERHCGEVNSLERLLEDLRVKCETYELERKEQMTKVEFFMRDLSEIEKN